MTPVHTEVALSVSSLKFEFRIPSDELSNLHALTHIVARSMNPTDSPEVGQTVTRAHHRELGPRSGWSHVTSFQSRRIFGTSYYLWRKNCEARIGSRVDSRGREAALICKVAYDATCLVLAWVYQVDLLLKLQDMGWRIFYGLVRVIWRFLGLNSVFCLSLLLNACYHISAAVPFLSNNRWMFNNWCL